jgi:DNA-binding MarR family transcriptional regulator
MSDTRNLDEIASSLIDLVGAMNSPRQDDVLLREAGVSLDRALFPLLVRLSLSPSMGGAELAAQVGRDPSTVSRQIARLEELGLVKRQTGASDMRVKEAIITKAGARTIEMIKLARRRLLTRLMDGWTREDRAMLSKLLRRFSNAMRDRQQEF